MALADVEVQLAKVKKGPMCAVCALRASLPPSELDILDRWLTNPKMRYGEVEQSIVAGQLEVPFELPRAPQIGRHCRGECDARTKLR